VFRKKVDVPTNSTDNSQTIAAALAAYGLIIGLVFLTIFILQIIVAWRITAKAGYPGALSLLLLVPFVNFIVILIFAFAEWPIEARLRALSGGGMLAPPGTTLSPL
jgi:uncharacterized membrane protein YhaH (DUF805 family)